jgi:hypothetical protein
MTSPSLLRQSVAVINGLLLLLALPMLVAITYHASFIRFLEPLALIIFLFLKVLLHSAIYGLLIQLASGEERFFSYRLLWENARTLSPVYLVIHLIFAAGFLLISLTIPPHIRPSLAALMAHGDIIFVYVFVSWVIQRRYLCVRNISVRKIPVSIPEAFVLLALFIVEIVVYHVSHELPLGDYHLSNVPTFIKFYIHFLECHILARLILRPYPELSLFYHS